MMLLVFLKASVLLSATLAGAWLLRRTCAASRHQVWSLGFAALLALPLLGAALPALHVPLATATEYATEYTDHTDQKAATDYADHTDKKAATDYTEHTDKNAADSAYPGSSQRSRYSVYSVYSVAAVLWGAGTLAAVGALLVSLVRVRRLVRTSRPLDDPSWRDAAAAIAARAGVRRTPRLLVADTIGTPMAGGLWRPVIFLPAAAAAWDAERRDIVLAHEISHLARRDPLRHVAARLAVACYWFHPLAWVAARQSSLAREQACDEAVLALGIRPSVYARTLLELAERMSAPPRHAAALPMIEPSLLEKRVMAILKDTHVPARVPRPLAIAALAAVVTLPIAAARPVARSLTVTPAAVQADPPAISAASSATAAVTPSGRAEFRGNVQIAGGRTCWSDRDNSSDFVGYTDTDRQGAILERIGTAGDRRLVQRHFGDLRACMFAERAGADRPSEWMGRAARVVLETERGGTTHRLELVRAAGGVRQTWRVNGAERPFDTAAQAWRDALLALMDRSWEIAAIRGETMAMQGEMSALHGEETALRGQIWALRGDVTAMRGDQMAIRGEESSLRGEISAIGGEVSAMRGEISAEQGEISALVGSRYGAGETERARISAQIREHERAIEKLEQKLRDYDAAAKVKDVERRIETLDADAKVAEIEAKIRKFDEASKSAAIEKEIAALDVDRKTAEIQRQIRQADAVNRTERLEKQLDEDLRRLAEALKAIR